MCVFLLIHSGHQVRWMYQPGSHRRKVTQDFSSPFLQRCVPHFFLREGFSNHSFPSSTVKSNFAILCTPLVGHSYFLFIFLFLVRKSRLPGSNSSCPNVSEGYEVTSELPGRPQCFLQVMTNNTDITVPRGGIASSLFVFTCIGIPIWDILFVTQLPSCLERWALLPFGGFPTLICFLFL